MSPQVTPKWFKIPGEIGEERDVFVKVDNQEDEISLHQQVDEQGWYLVELDCAPDWYIEGKEPR